MKIHHSIIIVLIVLLFGQSCKSVKSLVYPETIVQPLSYGRFGVDPIFVVFSNTNWTKIVSKGQYNQFYDTISDKRAALLNFDENGNKIGVWKIYWLNGNVRCHVVFNKIGELERYHEYDSLGNLMLSIKKPHNVTCYNESHAMVVNPLTKIVTDSVIKSSTYGIDGVYFWYINNKVKYRYELQDCKSEGISIEYNENGTKKIECDYKNGYLIGECKIFSYDK